MRRAPALFALLLAVGACAHDRSPPPRGWSLRSAAIAHLRALGRIGDRNRNTRAAGPPGYDASLDYVADRLRAAGYVVRLQDVRFPVFRDRTRPRLDVAGHRVPVLSLRYSGPGRASAGVAPVGLGCSPGDDRRARGRIVIAERGRCFFRVKARIAQAAGARGLIVADARSRQPVGGSLGRPGVRIPAVARASCASRRSTSTADPTTRPSPRPASRRPGCTPARRSARPRSRRGPSAARPGGRWTPATTDAVMSSSASTAT